MRGSTRAGATSSAAWPPPSTPCWRRSPALSEGDRQRLLRDVVAQLSELGTLVADLVDLAREDAGAAVRDEVRLDDLAADAVDRARLHFSAQDFELEAEPCLVVA